MMNSPEGRRIGYRPHGLIDSTRIIDSRKRVCGFESPQLQRFAFTNRSGELAQLLSNHILGMVTDGHQVEFAISNITAWP